MPKKSAVEKEHVSAAAAAAPARARRRPVASSKKHAAAEQVSTETRTAESTGIAVGPSREEIAKLAYLYWEARGRQGGSEEEDWLRAELTLRGR
ncbi:MAG: DUF2934 domain-containing protein [Bryobacteraceae bacterium]|jgi:hypothetical protein